MGKRKTPIALAGLEKDAIDLIRSLAEFKLIGIIDPGQIARNVGIAILGADKDWPRIRKKHPGLRVCIALDEPEKRESLGRLYGFRALTQVVSGHAYVASGARLGPACLIQRGVTIMADAIVGVGCKINIGATVHHDCRVGDFSTLAPGCQLLGSVQVGKKVFVGAGAIILPGLRVGTGATIGAGAVVTRSIAAGATVVGVPARSTETNPIHRRKT